MGIGVFALIVAVTSLVVVYLHVPFKPYSCHVVDIDVTARRNVSMVDEIEKYILDNGFDEFRRQDMRVSRWRGDCVDKACRSLFRQHRLKQYQELDSMLAPFQFKLVRKHTRYRQQNYVKMPYTVWDVDDAATFQYDELLRIYNSLKAIGFETTTARYFAKNQRSLMTPALRLKIKERDNYTCRMCGKRMPDEVGLHIDHIVPISKGGKTVESNLQVLCDKCNLRKNNKVAM